jgi:hypothetical protein
MVSRLLNEIAGTGEPKSDLGLIGMSPPAPVPSGESNERREGLDPTLDAPPPAGGAGNRADRLDGRPECGARRVGGTGDLRRRSLVPAAPHGRLVWIPRNDLSVVDFRRDLHDDLGRTGNREDSVLERVTAAAAPAFADHPYRYRRTWLKLIACQCASAHRESAKANVHPCSKVWKRIKALNV